ncbi:ladderlectin-like [Mastacembelus armatus]|uniref:ladderlectin-like n=1 Tax=Mastacembelus armatus TaxID=205130 RepID=UPI000E45ABCE|nr:ladderlectin-like [Mastacembelus armatus]
MKTLILAALLCALLALDTAQGQNRCPRGWTLSYGRCFIFVPRAMTWPDAEKNCQSLGGNLASVHHDIDYQVVQNVIYIVKGTGPAWIGGTNAQQVNYSPVQSNR